MGKGSDKGTSGSGDMAAAAAARAMQCRASIVLGVFRNAHRGYVRGGAELYDLASPEQRDAIISTIIGKVRKDNLLKGSFLKGLIGKDPATTEYVYTCEICVITSHYPFPAFL